MFEYDKYAAEAAETLDKYDFTVDVNECLSTGTTDMYDVRAYLRSKYGDDVERAFGVLDTTEFMIYMTARYNVRWDERTTYHMWKPRNPKTAGFFK